MNSLTPEDVAKLSALQRVTSLYYYDETDIPVDVLWAIATAMRASITGEGLSEALAKWKRAITYEIESSRFISSFEINELSAILQEV